MSSIRRSSLLSITLGLLLTVIGASFVRFLEKAAGQSTAHLSFAFAHVRMARAGPYYCVGGGLGPARFGSYRTPWGAWGCFRIYRGSNVRSSGLRSFDIRQRLLFE
jgi:hypothetical protein